MTETHASIPPQVRVLEAVQDFWASRALWAAAELGVFDHLRTARSASDLAGTAGWHAPSLERLLRALAARGWLEREADGRYRLSAQGEILADGPHSMRSFVRSVIGHGHYEPWGEGLLRTIADGGVAFDHHFGMPVWEYYEQHPAVAAVFNDAMTSYSDATAAAVLASYDFSGFRKVVDIGGGHGRLLTGVLGQATEAVGVLFDQPSVIAGAEVALAASGRADRCQVQAGDFFAAVPEGGDCYLLKFIIHDWDDERALGILGRVRAAMAEDARVLLVEAVLDDEPGADDFGVHLDLNMLAITGGRERTRAEYAALLGAAGLRLRQVVATGTTVSVVEAGA